METRLELIDVYKVYYSDNAISKTEIYVFSESRKPHGEINTYSGKTYGITVKYFIADPDFFIITEIYNMVIGKKYMSRRIKTKVEKMIKNKQFNKHKYLTEYYKNFGNTIWTRHTDEA